MNAAAVVLITLGVLFLAISAIGLIRFPDFYSRAHVVAKSETLGIMLVVVGLAVARAPDPGAAKLLIILVFAFVANPVAIHALAGAARRLDEQTTGELGHPTARSDGPTAEEGSAP